ncbi:MAG: helix-turn-helix domain-containing protein [Cyclobacteriaceae bacterium]|jgi:transcriptional regulator with XRE-family HTH domain
MNAKFDSNKSSKKEISERLKLIRIGNNLSPKEMAEKLGLTRVYWSALEKGNRILSFSVILLLNKHFGISADWLVFGHQKPEVSDPELAVDRLYNRLIWMIELHEKQLNAADTFTSYVNTLIRALDQVRKIEDKGLSLESFSRLEKAMLDDFNDLFEQYFMAINYPKAGYLIRPPKKVPLFVSEQLQMK